MRSLQQQALPDMQWIDGESIKIHTQDQSKSYSGSIKISIYLDQIGHCKTASCTNLSSRWTYRVCIIDIPDEISTAGGVTSHAMDSRARAEVSCVAEP